MSVPLSQDGEPTMKVTYRWMKEFLSFDITPREMIERLITIGHEVDEVVDLGLLDNPIRIARITRVEPHPTSEQLTICHVDDGSPAPAVVVCGAPNVKVGAIGVLARAGARLPDGTVLKRAKIRGVASEGMLLAYDELGLGSDHTGIVSLDADAPVGEGYDVILTVEITPNRADCLSVFGLARDLAASYGRKFYFPPVRIRETYEDSHDLGNVSVKCPEDCPRYTARLIRNVQIKPSPGWVRRKLLAVGLRPINNVVDATNLVLMELGHPLHAFDFDRLREQRIVVRLADEGETLRLLDETHLQLKKGKDMVIADGVGPVALAGIMGGGESEVTPQTRNLLIESAQFRATTIRQTAKRHNLGTDASYRFERGTDILNTTLALERVTSLILELAGGDVPRGIFDTCPRPPAPKTLLLRVGRAKQFLGVDIPKTAIADMLANLGFETIRSDGEALVLSIPTYRVDVAREEDLFEEIARIHGYDRIAPTMPLLPMAPNPLNPIVRLRRHVQDRLVGLGLCEAISLSFLGENELEQLGLGSQGTLRLLNPMSSEQALLRPDLTPSMVRLLVYNQNRGNADAQLFEIGHTFRFGDMATPTVEKEALVIGLMGAAHDYDWKDQARRPADFFDLKGIVLDLLDSIRLTGVTLEAGGPRFLHPGRSARILVGDRELGWMGELGPAERDRTGFAGRPQLAELDMDALLELADYGRSAADVPRFPGIERDLALVVRADLPAADLEAAIRESAGQWLEALRLFDCYTGEQVLPGMKSLAYRALYRHPDRTLTDDEVETFQSRIVEAVGREFGAALR